ncbi:MAG: Crp/Fnr family transcriptional regulator [Methylibium sp.]|nr:Crp/Fnr family transcriptional regulator [Methylibium sp.]
MQATFDLVRYLSVLPLFSGLPAQDRERIAREGCSLQRLERGDMLFTAGDRCDAFHLVVTGHLKVYLVADNGAEKVFELAGPGQPIAELCVFNEHSHGMSAQALTPALLVRVPKAAVTALVLHHPAFALRMLAGASQRMQGLLRDVESYCLHSGLRRVVGYLLDQLDDVAAPCRSGTPLTVSLPVSKAAIAARLSLTPEYFSRVLRELEEAGLISMDRREIHIPDTSRLAHYSQATA